MKHSDSVTSVQFAIIIAGTILGVSILALPRFVIEEAGNAAPLASVVGMIISFIGLLGLLYLGKRFPNQTFIGYSKTILGKLFGNFIMVLFLLVALVLIGLETRQFAEVLVGGLLPDTPIHFSIFAMLFLCSVINFSNVSTFAYIHFFYFPLIIIPLLIVLLPSFKDIEYYHLLPITGHEISLTEFMSGAIVIMAAVSNYYILSMVIPYLKNPKKCVTPGIWGFLIGTFFVLFLVTISLAVFGEMKILEMLWSTLVLARMVEVPGEILARIDAIFIISWIFAVFTTLLSYYFIFVRGVAEIFSTKKYRLISFIALPIAFFIALFPRDIFDVYSYLRVFWTGSVMFYFVYVFFLMVIAKVRRKKGSVG
ncbi:spore germination protein [Ureibacillus xyleni]|uniref:Spore germination protein n=1 Tax=Ureibacillus xyleni TaxID=614648 RepID=A0A285TA18_9BACL|nr:endospore germination permease [Ureibacillus xyleni]SOC18082.1 spore germination protein [Ureibacillus xyleni]